MSKQLIENLARRGVSGDGPTALRTDLLWGVEAIANEIGQTVRQTYYQLERGKLPAMKQAGKWTASRSGLRAHFASILGGKVA